MDSGPRVTFFTFHTVVPSPLAVPHGCFLDRETFGRYLRYIVRRYEVVSLGDALDRLTRPAGPRPLAVLTFDDGFQDVCDVVLPMLEARGLAATVFLVTDLVDGADTLWFCRLHRALTETRRSTLSWRGEERRLETRRQRADACAWLEARMKRLPTCDLGSEVAAVCEALDVTVDAPVERGSPYRLLQRAGIARLLDSGLVTLGAHSRRHAILSRLSADEQDAEIGGSLDAVGRWTGQPCRWFAYPNGQPGDWDAGSLSSLSRHGVGAAFTGVWGTCDARTPRLTLNRCGVSARELFAWFGFRAYRTRSRRA